MEPGEKNTIVCTSFSYCHVTCHVYDARIAEDGTVTTVPWGYIDGVVHHTHDPIPVEGWDCDSGPMGLPWGYIDGVVHHTHDPIPYPIPYKLAKS